jgi:hypothetical protein
MTTDIKEAARASARISDGDEFPEPHMEPQLLGFVGRKPGEYIFENCTFNGQPITSETQSQVDGLRYQVPLKTRLTLDELLQRPMPWTGLTIAAAIVCFCAWVALLVHAAGVHGWLR